MKNLMTISLMLISTAALAISQQSPAAPQNDPVAFLKWSMDRYAALPSYQATVTTSMTGGLFGGISGLGNQTIFILYKKPNLYKIVAIQAQVGMVGISDGKKAITYGTMAIVPATTGPAPSSLADSAPGSITSGMQDPTLKFLGGSASYGQIVDPTKSAPTFGNEIEIDGHKCREVKYDGSGALPGKVTLAIGEDDGMIRRSSIDMGDMYKSLMKAGQTLPQGPDLRQNLKDKLASFPASAKKDTAMATVDSMATNSSALTEMAMTTSISDISSPTDLPDSLFDATLPKGVSTKSPFDLGGDVKESIKFDAGSTDKPPVRLGSMAPDISFTSPSGKPVKLSSFRGHPVLIDFWATWCPPCREGLPETNKLFKKGAPKGLKVLAISDESAATISKFCKENKYVFTQYRDQGDKAEGKYKITGIPTTVIIDSKGRLKAFFVGLQSPSVIEAALKKVGVKI